MFNAIKLFNKIIILLLILSTINNAQSNGRPKKVEVFGVAFLRSMFSNVDYNDAKAAIKVYIEELQKALLSGYGMKPVMFDNTEDLLRTYKKYNLADITLNTVDFLKYRKKLSLYPILVSSGRTSPLEEYYLLVRKDKNIYRLQDLADKKLGILSKGNNPLPYMWLDVVLNKNKIYSRNKFFEKIIQGKTESQLIMSVFFNQLSACIVSKTSFETIIELNPQIEKQLKILKTSPAFLLTVSSFTKNFQDSPYSSDLKRQLIKLDSYSAGKQLFILTKTEKLVRFKEIYLKSVIKLYNEYSKLPKKEK